MVRSYVLPNRAQSLVSGRNAKRWKINDVLGINDSDEVGYLSTVTYRFLPTGDVQLHKESFISVF
jgi:hypothetical protein